MALLEYVHKEEVGSQWLSDPCEEVTEYTNAKKLKIKYIAYANSSLVNQTLSLGWYTYNIN